MMPVSSEFPKGPQYTKVRLANTERHLLLVKQCVSSCFCSSGKEYQIAQEVPEGTAGNSDEPGEEGDQDTAVARRGCQSRSFDESIGPIAGWNSQPGKSTALGDGSMKQARYNRIACLFAALYVWTTVHSTLIDQRLGKGISQAGQVVQSNEQQSNELLRFLTSSFQCTQTLRRCILSTWSQVERLKDL